MTGTGKHMGKMLKAERAIERIRSILRDQIPQIPVTVRIAQIIAVVERVRAPVPKKRRRCNAKFFDGMTVRCYRVPGHGGNHSDGTYIWPGTSIASNSNAFSES